MRKNKLAVFLIMLLLGACQQNNVEVLEPSIQHSLAKERLWITQNASEVSTKAVALKDRLWQPGSIIMIKFLNDPYGMQNQIIECGKEWEKYANIEFRYVSNSEDADVKISFDIDDRWISWAYIGTDCKNVAQTMPSLNFSGFDYQTALQNRSDILRAFGHILGLGLEYKSPASNVVFKPTADIAGEYNLSAQEALDFINYYSVNQANYTAYDKLSVMAIDIPRGLVVNPSLATTRNSELSGNDTTFIAQLYPPTINPSDSIIVKMTTYSKYLSIWLGFKLTNDITIDWGDGHQNMLTSSDEYCNHLYNDSIEYSITIKGTPESIVNFSCFGNRITTLDVSKNTALENLHCNENLLTDIDVSQNRALTDLWCHENQLSYLNISRNTKLKILYCGPHNLLTSLDISNNLSLEELHGGGLNFLNFDVSHNTALRLLSVGDENFTYDALLKIANDIVDRNGKATGNLFFNSIHYNDSIRALFNTKNWE